MLRLVGEARAPVLELGDPRLGVGRGDPLRVGQALAFPFPVEPDRVLGRGRCDPALLGQPVEHRPVALAIIPPHDRPQGRVGLHRGRINPNPLAPDQAVLGQPLEHPGEDRLVHLQRQSRPRLLSQE